MYVSPLNLVSPKLPASVAATSLSTSSHSGYCRVFTAPVEDTETEMKQH